MSQELKPCPFCGCAMAYRVSNANEFACGEHLGRCVFAGHDQILCAKNEWNNRDAPVPPSGDVPEYFVAACGKFDWTPEEALRFYAEGKHFDTVGGRTRILCTGAIASHALKGLAGPYADMKGIEPAGEVEVLASLGLTLAVLNEAFNAPDSAERLANMDVPRVMRATFKDFERVKTEVTRLQAENAALQQRLNVADQRVDDLQSELLESRKIQLSGCEFTEHELLARAVRAARGTSKRGVYRWIAMKDAFGCGSGVANALCHRFGFDPDETVKP